MAGEIREKIILEQKASGEEGPKIGESLDHLVNLKECWVCGK